MAYIVGYLTEEETVELTRRGWELEDAPPMDSAPTTPNPRPLKLVFVDSSMFEIMTGPDWDKGPNPQPALFTE